MIHATEPKWFFAPASMALVCLTQRCGSTSMDNALRSADNKPLARREVPVVAAACSKVLMWIRNPYDRFASACGLFGNDFPNINHFARHAMLHRNAHWDSQVYLHTLDYKFLPTVVYDFGKLAETWAAELPDYELKHTDDGIRHPPWAELEPTMDAGVRQEFDRHWAADLSLYQEVA